MYATVSTDCAVPPTLRTLDTTIFGASILLPASRLPNTRSTYFIGSGATVYNAFFTHVSLDVGIDVLTKNVIIPEPHAPIPTFCITRSSE